MHSAQSASGPVCDVGLRGCERCESGCETERSRTVSVHDGELLFQSDEALGTARSNPFLKLVDNERGLGAP